MRAFEYAARRRVVVVVAAHAHFDVAFAGEAVVGGIERQPEPAGQKRLDPGVAFAGADQPARGVNRTSMNDSEAGLAYS